MKIVNIDGNLGADAEVVTFEQSQKQAVTFRVASTNSRNDITEWISVVYFRPAIAPYLKKGTKVIVDGEEVPYKYTNRNGEVMEAKRVQADHVRFFGQKPQQQAAPVQQEVQVIPAPPVPQPQTPMPPPQEDELPF